MGRAIVRNPKVFLFDEPLSNLDAKLRVQMRAEIKELHQRLRTTTIYVTHDQIEAMTMADRVVVMQGGRIEQVGPPLSLYDRPRNLFVASFLGSPAMNLIEGRFDGADGSCTFRADAGPCLSIARPAGVAPGQAVVIGLRPEHLRLAQPEAAAIVAKVVVVEPSGADTLLTLRAERLNMAVFLRERSAVRPDELVGLSIEDELVHVFDASTGERIDGEPPALASRDRALQSAIRSA
jgi:multiple sugar transport system ATP-binding protein